MTRWLQAVLAVTVGLSLPLLARAQTYPVDDSSSEVVGGNVRMRWDQGAPQPGQRPTVSGEVTVLVRLNVSAWQGRQGRIYMSLPAQPSGPVHVSWSTRGRLLPGVMRDGERSLVYAGPIQTAVIEDTQRLLIRADGGKLVRSEQLKFSFEIDVESP